MERPTYKQQFDKLTRAYIEHRVNPYDYCACFIGNLLNGKDAWRHGRWYPHLLLLGRVRAKDTPNGYAVQCILRESGGLYSVEDTIRLESNFLEVLEGGTIGPQGYSGYSKDVLDHPNYENALFEAFSSTLDILKEIHEAAGEQVDEFTFQKREGKYESANV